MSHWRFFGEIKGFTLMGKCSDPGKSSQLDTLWMDEILHHFETMGNHCLLAFAGQSSFQGLVRRWCRILSIHSRPGFYSVHSAMADHFRLDWKP